MFTDSQPYYTKKHIISGVGYYGSKNTDLHKFAHLMHQAMHFRSNTYTDNVILRLLRFPVSFLSAEHTIHRVSIMQLNKAHQTTRITVKQHPHSGTFGINRVAVSITAAAIHQARRHPKPTSFMR